jgi:hypothetical protein
MCPPPLFQSTVAGFTIENSTNTIPVCAKILVRYIHAYIFIIRRARHLWSMALEIESFRILRKSFQIIGQKHSCLASTYLKKCYQIHFPVRVVVTWEKRTNLSEMMTRVWQMSCVRTGTLCYPSGGIETAKKLSANKYSGSAARNLPSLMCPGLRTFGIRRTWSPLCLEAQCYWNEEKLHPSLEYYVHFL